MRRVWGGSAVAMLAMVLRAGAARAQANEPPVGILPVWGVVRPPRAGADVPYRVPATTTYGVLDEMASRAAVIFVGSVRSVRWLGGSGEGAASGVVAVEFAVEEGIVGPASGTTYVMREWAGLWRDAARFRVGQRRLMLLHAPGPGGLSSPVDGLDGAIPIVGDAGATSQAGGDQAGGVPAKLAELQADLRWLQAKQMRTVALAGEPVASPGEQAAAPLTASVVARPLVGVGRAVMVAGSAVVAAQPLPVERTPPLAEVIGRLRAGEGPQRAAR